MGVNSFTFKQNSTMLNDIIQQLSGEKQIAAVDEAEFVSVATTALSYGYDPLKTAISQVISKSLWVARAYEAVYPSLERNEEEWGGIVRKVTTLDIDFEDDKGYTLQNGVSGPDPFVVNMQKAVQFNFYGGNVYELIITTTEQQLKQAFRSSAEFGSFMAAKTVELQNLLEQKIEAESRIAVNNTIAADILADDERVWHVLTDYKAATGNTTITDQNYLSEAEFTPFSKWFYGALRTKKRFLRNRSVKFHQKITDYTYKDEDGVDHTITLAKPIKRHTPDRFLNTYLLSQFMDQVNSSVLSGVYNKELLDAGNFEYVDFWQAMENPDEIIVQPNVLNEHGVCSKAAEAVAQAGVLGILFDDEAIGITVMNEGVRSIENPRGRYFNDFHNFLIRYYNDQTENSMVILLD